MDVLPSLLLLETLTSRLFRTSLCVDFVIKQRVMKSCLIAKVASF